MSQPLEDKSELPPYTCISWRRIRVCWLDTYTGLSLAGLLAQLREWPAAGPAPQVPHYSLPTCSTSAHTPAISCGPLNDSWTCRHRSAAPFPLVSNAASFAFHAPATTAPAIGGKGGALLTFPSCLV